MITRARLGVAACRFAELLPKARVLAVDGAEPLLALARERASRLGVADRLDTRHVSLSGDLADLAPADLVWVSGVVHHLPDPVAALCALGALVRRWAVGRTRGCSAHAVSARRCGTGPAAPVGSRLDMARELVGDRVKPADAATLSRLFDQDDPSASYGVPTCSSSA